MVPSLTIAEERPAIKRNLYVAEKYIYGVIILSLTIRFCKHSFSRYCLRNMRNRAKFREKIELIAVQCHPRSWSRDVSRTVFKISTQKARK